MKHAVKLVALALVLVMAVSILASCGGPSGTYEALVANSGARLTFKGNDVKVAILAVGIEVATADLEYEIEDGKISFIIPEGANVTNEAIKALVGTPVDYEEVDGGIKIAGVTYTKVDK